METSELIWGGAAFLLTVAIEWPLFAWFSGLGFRRTALFCLLMNAATWFAMAGIQACSDVPVPLLEAGITLAETAIIAWFWSWGALRALRASLLMNLSSWFGGSALLYFIMRRLGAT